MISKDWRDTLLDPSHTILDAIKRINSTTFRIALVLDNTDRLVGTVTDGDIRRGLLQGVPVESVVTLVMNRSPRTARPDEPWNNVCTRFGSVLLRQVPIVDEAGLLLDLKAIDTAQAGQRENWVVLMAGGKGQRLRPLTETMPKPMIKVGPLPIIETTLRSFKRQGFSRFYVAVNHKAEILRAHLGDGDCLGLEIRYLEEDEPLGTAGALSLIPEIPDQPLIVMNADLLTKLNFEELLNFHANHGAAVTMCVREYDFQVPFGVVKVDGQHRINEIREKPIYTFFINAGIYVFNPDVIEQMRGTERRDMPDFLQGVMERGNRVAAFPVHEYWLDVGNFENLTLAESQFAEVFGSKPSS